MATTVTIIATPEVVQLAKTAMEIQDACNAYAVANTLQKAQEHFRKFGNGQNMSGSDMGLQNPISIALLNKLNDLARMEQSKTECYGACIDLSDGKDTEWYIDELS